MAKHYSYREMKGERNEPPKTRYIVVDLVEIKFGGYSQPHERIKFLERIKLAVYEKEEGRYDIKHYIENYLKEKYGLIFYQATRKLKGKLHPKEDVLMIQVQARKPFRNEKI